MKKDSLYSREDLMGLMDLTEEEMQQAAAERIAYQRAWQLA